jgi:hypothetical protein
VKYQKKLKYQRPCPLAGGTTSIRFEHGALGAKTKSHDPSASKKSNKYYQSNDEFALFQEQRHIRISIHITIAPTPPEKICYWDNVLRRCGPNTGLASNGAREF